ncbi:hypothetical protein FO521_29830 [Bacillus pseudomycoides]|nr:hypothetical protein [Bacillus pseudomycoides]
MVEAIKDTAIGSPDLTAKWEEYLKCIGDGKKDYMIFVETSKELTEKLVAGAEVQANKWIRNEFV